MKKSLCPAERKCIDTFSSNGNFYGDGILLANEDKVDNIYHPYYSAKHSTVSAFESEPLLHPIMKNGQRLHELPTPIESAQYAKKRMRQFKSRTRNASIIPIFIRWELVKS
ncbi:MAG: hypothetical protein U5J63_05250 [Fodinibius sp.]|nr:hypothetical protein [Fodinibius sp.]